MEAETFPALNAALNAISALLLTFGYSAIRRHRNALNGGRMITLHKACMLSALAVSMLFLTSYLYYHIVVRGGRPTYFQGQGIIRPIYFALLLSHTLLAAIVAPMALYTAYQGLRGRLARHVWIARWTLPIWLYVSVTGVLVYVMLYRLYPAP
jgi:putative membrane protein